MQNQMAWTRPAPKLGLLINSIDVFNPEAKDKSEEAVRKYFDQLVKSGAVHPESMIRGRIFGPHEARAAADEFAAVSVDVVVIANVAFPNGHVFLTFATHPQLAKTPIAVMAEPEPESNEWATNAWCGVIMNNFVAKQIGRNIVTIPGKIGTEEFDDQFSRLLRVAGAIKFLRSEFIVRFGDAPSGFHSATGNQLAFASTFGTRVDTVDLSAVMHVYKTGTVKGYLGESTFTDDDVQKTVQEMMSGCEVQVDKEMIEKGARLYHAYRAIIRANGYTSAAVRCWPEIQSDVIPMASCLSQGWLLAKGDVAAVACESDWPTAVAQTMGTILSGKPAACLDWVNYTGGSEIIELGHCGVGMAGMMAPKGPGCCSGVCDAIAQHPVARQAGAVVGPVHIGQYEYGMKTGICLMQGPDGWFRMLAFSGESTPETARGKLYSAADIKVEDFKELNHIILEYGFPHHLAVAMGDITEDLHMLCGLLDVEYVSP
jgi:L-fucose isomerase-like protein